MDVFDLINDASLTKKNLMRGSEDDEAAESVYSPVTANRAFSMHPSSVLHANLMNLHHSLPKRAQYEFYLYSLPKLNRKSKGKWPKEEKDPLLDAIQLYYKCSRTVAKQYEKLLSKDDKKELLRVCGDPVKAPSHK